MVPVRNGLVRAALEPGNYSLYASPFPLNGAPVGKDEHWYGPWYSRDFAPQHVYSSWEARFKISGTWTGCERGLMAAYRRAHKIWEPSLS